MFRTQNQGQCHKTKSNCRYLPIDVFRGFAILGMVFFTVTLRLSKDLPDILRHNVWGSLHMGDFVLPMFLFASGLSLAFFLQKREKDKQSEFLRKIIKRFFTLVAIGILLSFFSAYGFLEMDEVMLSSLCFIICVILYRFDWKINMGVIFFICLSYFVLLEFNKENIFIGHYLGGYPAVIYYLPLMLVGLYLGKGIISSGVYCKNNKIIMTLIFAFFLFFWFFIPIHKLTITPSFILLSILISFLIFVVTEQLVRRISSLGELEYIGRKPLRYWLLMYSFFLIPLSFYIELTGMTIPLNIHWLNGVIISIILVTFLWGLSHTIDYFNIIEKIFR